MSHVVGTEGEAAAVLIGPGPIGAPQKNAARHGATSPTSGAGQGVAPQFGSPEASRSSRLGKSDTGRSKSRPDHKVAHVVCIDAKLCVVLAANTENVSEP